MRRLLTADMSLIAQRVLRMRVGSLACTSLQVLADATQEELGMRAGMHDYGHALNVVVLLQLSGVAGGGSVSAVVQAQPSLLVQQDSAFDQVAPHHDQ